MNSQFLNGKKLKFMIVDDDPTIREVISEILKVNGQEVIEAIDGDECIRKIKSNKGVNIILLDIRMPGARTPEILEAVRNSLPKASVIYLTSVKAFEPTKEDLKMGWTPEITSPVIGYIEKPVSQDELLQKISDYLDKNQKIMSFKRITTKKKTVKKK